ncbi:MAG: hypothetical protein HY074_15540 [Deltaproteobacteria bacterium]|nr:hypothetical protein [Deltaproteobacteria bacterium]
MHSLFRLFSHIILKVTALYVVVSFVGILALDKLFGGYEFYLGMLVFIGPLLAWGLTFMLVPKNLDWILALPISKRNVLALHYMTSVFASVVIFMASLVVLVMLVFIKRDVHVMDLTHVHHVAAAAPTQLLRDQLEPILAGIDIYGWMTALLMISFFHALSMSISRPATTKRFYINLWNAANPLVRWSVRTGWVAFIALAAVFREYFLSPFGIFVIATLLFLFMTTVNTSNALGLGKRQRSRWIAVAAGVAGVQIIFLFSHAMSGVRSESFDRRVASVMFLGPFSGGMAKADLAHLLEAGINNERVEELGELYRKRFWHKMKIKATADYDLNFLRAIESKKAFQDVVSILRLFDASDFNGRDIKAVFAKLQPLMNDCRCEFYGYDLLAAKFDVGDARELLATGQEAAVQFVLLWARYHASRSDVALVSAIEKGFTGYSDRAKLSALMTLSVLRGVHVTFNEWLGGRKGRTVSSAVDCSTWQPKPVAELTAADAPALNQCIRRRAETAQASEIEAAGWIEPPFDIKTRATIRKVFRIK